MSTVLKAEKLFRSKKALFHASHTGNLQSILKHGLLPQHGAISKSTDAYQVMTQGIDHFGKEIEVPPVTFLGEDPGHYVHWQVANKLGKNMNNVTQKEISDHGVVVIVRKDARQIHSKANPHEDEPPHVEDPDYYSMDDIYPKVILTGKELIMFLQRNSPEYLKRFP